MAVVTIIPATMSARGNSMGCVLSVASRMMMGAMSGYERMMVVALSRDRDVSCQVIVSCDQRVGKWFGKAEHYPPLKDRVRTITRVVVHGFVRLVGHAPALSVVVLFVSASLDEAGSIGRWPPLL